jgi:hypothetical protein
MRCAHVARIHKFDARAGGGGVDHYYSQCQCCGDVFAKFAFLFEYASGMLLVISIRSKQTVYTHTLDPLATLNFSIAH